MLAYCLQFHEHLILRHIFLNIYPVYIYIYIYIYDSLDFLNKYLKSTFNRHAITKYITITECHNTYYCGQTYDDFIIGDRRLVDAI